MADDDRTGRRDDRAERPDAGHAGDGPDGGHAGDGVDAPSAGRGDALASAVFAIGLLAFVGSGLAYVVVLATGGDVLAPLVVNAVAALTVVAWTARDTYADPDSGVTSLPGALGTALLMLGVYGLAASVAVALTSLWHGRFDLALRLGVAAAVVAVLGFFTFPAEVLGPSAGGDGAEPPTGAQGESTDRE